MIHWTPDTWGDAHSTGEALLRAGRKTFFLIVAWTTSSSTACAAG